jgi:hypothetical protein
MQPEEWEGLIEAAAANRPAPFRAHTFLRSLDGVSDPVAVACDDGREYAVKGRQCGRSIVNDHVVGMLGALLEAPVAEVRLVTIPPDLVQVESALRHIPPGVCHGSLWIPGCRELEVGTESEIGVPENSLRFARLAVLFGWVGGKDRQFICHETPPPLVYSVDHGHFFPDGPNWTTEGLLGAPKALPDGTLRRRARLAMSEVTTACQALASVLPGQLAKVVAQPPDEWGISLGERVALASYLERRRSELLTWERFHSRKG